MLFYPFKGYLVFNVFNKVIPGCRPERFADLSVCYDRPQFANSIAAWVYAFGVTIVTLVALELFMFLSRKRGLRGGRGRRAVTQTVEDRGTIRDPIVRSDLLPPTGVLKRLPGGSFRRMEIEYSGTRCSKRRNSKAVAVGKTGEATGTTLRGEGRKISRYNGSRQSCNSSRKRRRSSGWQSNGCRSSGESNS